MTGYGDKPIQFNDGVRFMEDDNVFPDKFLISYNSSGSNICINDVETSKLQADLSFPYFPLSNIKWNSEQSSFLVTNGEENQYYIIKKSFLR